MGDSDAEPDARSRSGYAITRYLIERRFAFVVMGDRTLKLNAVVDDSRIITPTG